MGRVYGVRRTGYAPTLLASGGPPPPIQGAAAGMRAFCTYFDAQNSQECTGEGFEDARWIAVAGRGRRGSAHGLYTAGRMRERARRGDAVQDIGADPWDTAEGCVSVGVYPRDDWDTDPTKVNAPMNWSESAGLRLFSVDDLHPIDYGDLATVEQWHLAGVPVVFWTDVDQAYESLQNGQVWPGITTLPILGGHCRVLLPRPPGQNFYEEWNSYGPSWASNGFGRLTPSSLAHAGLCAVSGGPIL